MTDKWEPLEYAVEVDVCPESGRVISEIWRNKAGELDRLGDLPAVTHYCPLTGAVTDLAWARNNEAHREGDKPAQITRDPQTGQDLEVRYFKNGKLHREEGKPALEFFTPEGRVLCRWFYQAGNKHRKCGPAIEQFDETSGKPAVREFWVHNIRVEPF